MTVSLSDHTTISDAVVEHAPGSVAAAGVSVNFGPTTALRDVSISILPGQICAIAGPSGSGKSTLLHCLAGLLVPDSGTVTVDGIEVTGLGEAARADLRLERFGFVFQFGHLIPELSIEDNVALPLRLRGTARRPARRAAGELLARLGLAGQAAKRPAEVSGGQYQRAAVARALVGRPAVVFADEPTGALDSTTAEAVLGELTALARERGSTVLIVSHDPEVVRHADRVIRLRDGQLDA